MNEDHVYEVQIRVGGGDLVGDRFSHVYYVDHRFPDLPARETLHGLKREAEENFRSLNAHAAVEECVVGVVYLTRQERED